MDKKKQQSRDNEILRKAKALLEEIENYKEELRDKCDDCPYRYYHYVIKPPSFYTSPSGVYTVIYKLR